jgi:Flp pilus assembly protein protease CpaA
MRKNVYPIRDAAKKMSVLRVLACESPVDVRAMSVAGTFLQQLNSSKINQHIHATEYLACIVTTAATAIAVTCTNPHYATQRIGGATVKSKAHVTTVGRWPYHWHWPTEEVHPCMYR